MASIALPGLGAPDWILSVFILLVILGFPLALVLAFALEVTPAGISKAKSDNDDVPIHVGLGDYAILGLVAVIALSSLFQIFNGSSNLQDQISEGPALTKTEALDGPSVSGLQKRAAIAVLPFSNASTNETEDYFADGITIDIITRLQTLRLFPIISKNSTFAYRGQSLDARSVGEALGADYIVEGTVRRSDEQLRVTAQLIESETGYSIWSSTYNRPTGDLFALQDDIANSIASALAPEIKRSEISKARARPSADPTAYDLYLQSIRLSRTEDFAEVQIAKANLERAIEIDPNFAPPLVELAWIEHDRITYYVNETTWEQSVEARDNAFAYGEKAVALDPQYAGGHAIYGHMLLHYKKPKEGLIGLRRSVELNPSSSEHHSNYAWGLIANGEHDEAIKEYEIARTLNPQDPMAWEIYQNIGYAHLFSGRYQEAIASTNEGLLLNPNNFYSLMTMVCANNRLGRTIEAKAALEAFGKLAPTFSTKSLDLTSFSNEAIAVFKEDFFALGWEDAY